LAGSIRTYGPTEQALQHYAAQRLPAGLAIVERARYLGDHMQGHQKDTTNSFGAQDSDAAWVLQHTAVDLGGGEVSLQAAHSPAPATKSQQSQAVLQ
jgi:hypothetical protein